jgi:hypothetical protein
MGATTNQNPAVMAPLRSRICAHIPCLCTVPEGEEYCGVACRDAAKQDAKTACPCDHVACPQTIRLFATFNADLQSL